MAYRHDISRLGTEQVMRQAIALLFVIISLLMSGAARAQMSRVEHDQLRLELREGLHRPVKVGPLDALGIDRLSMRERRLLRDQLRRHRLVRPTSLADNIDSVSDATSVHRVDTDTDTDPLARQADTNNAAVASTIAIPESVNVSRPIITSND